MKKLISAVLALIMLMALCSCTNKEPSGEAVEDNDKEATETVQEDVFETEANGITLKYPAKWQDTVNIEVTDNKVSFSYDGIALFDLIFGESNEYLLGTYDDSEIHLRAYDVDPESVTEEQYDNICAMQDDVNVLIKCLQNDVGFKLS